MTDWIAAGWPAPKSIVAGTCLRDGRFETLKLSGSPCWLEQVHGNEIVTAKRYASPPRADGSVSRNPQHICVVRTADCLPVLLCSSDGAVAAAHAGWRGLAAGVLENTVRSMQVTDPGQILAWLGPAISQASFEVGDEVKAAFVGHNAAAAVFFDRNSRDRWQADLYGLARQRLAEAGVTRTYGGGFCTFKDSKRFHSYRRDPSCGRMVSLVALMTP